MKENPSKFRKGSIHEVFQSVYSFISSNEAPFIAERSSLFLLNSHFWRNMVCPACQWQESTWRAPDVECNDLDGRLLGFGSLGRLQFAWKGGKGKTSPTASRFRFMSVVMTTLLKWENSVGGKCHSQWHRFRPFGTRVLGSDVPASQASRGTLQEDKRLLFRLAGIYTGWTVKWVLLKHLLRKLTWQSTSGLGFSVEPMRKSEERASRRLGNTLFRRDYRVLEERRLNLTLNIRIYPMMEYWS